MATESRRTDDALNRGRGRERPPRTVEQRLFDEGHAFDFFQAVRLLHWLSPERPRVGQGGPPRAEPVRFRSLASLSFPASAIYDLSPRGPNAPTAVMVQTFLGLTGPSGVLPRHYTELVMRLDRERRDPERYVLRDWLDLFNHRWTSLFYRAWEKYRPYLVYERSRGEPSDRDPFTFTLLCLVGLGQPALRDRLRVTARRTSGPGPREVTLDRVDDLALIHYGGLFSHRPRSAVGLESVVADYFGLPTEVRQFQGQWLLLEPSNQTRLGHDDGNNLLGYNALAGTRTWDLQGKFRIRLGPLSYEQFRELLPDRSPTPRRKAFFALGHLVRFYVGPGLDYDVQLVPRGDEVPDCQLPGDGTDGPALGWNTWLHSQPLPFDPEDAVFAGEEVSQVDG